MSRKYLIDEHRLIQLVKTELELDYERYGYSVGWTNFGEKENTRIATDIVRKTYEVYNEE